MKRIKLKQPYLSDILSLIQVYKTSPEQHQDFIKTYIDERLTKYAKHCGYVAIKFIPKWWKKENGKVYLTVRFQVNYSNFMMTYYNFSHFDKIIKAYNE